MGDDDKRQTDPGRVSAPPPDFDEDLVTQLTPGDELARWRRISARDEKPVFVRDPAPPPSRPALPRPKIDLPASTEVTPTRSMPAATVERTPTRGVSVPPFVSDDPTLDERVVSKATARDAPVSFPGQALRTPPLSAAPIPASRPAAVRSSPLVGASAPAPGARPVGLTSSVPDGASERPLGVFGAPRREADVSAPIPLVTPRSVPPLDAPSATPLAPPGAFASAPPAPHDARHKPALAPPPPSLSLPPRDEPAIPPAAPLGFEAPTGARPLASPPAPEGSGGRQLVLALAVLAILCGIIGGLYLAQNAGSLPTLGGAAPATTTTTSAGAPGPAGPGPSAPRPEPVPPAPAPEAPRPAGSEAAPTPSPPAGSDVAAPPPAGSEAAPTPRPPGSEVAAPPSPTDPGVPGPEGTAHAPSVTELLATADAALRAGEAERALEGYRAVIAADAHDPYGYAGAARSLLALDEPEDAISFAARAVAHRQRRASFRVLLGDCYQAHGEPARAREEWRAALELEPGNREAASRLGE